MKPSRRALWVTCLICNLLPLPALVFWRDSDGRSLALGLFFIGCAGLVADTFHHRAHSRIAPVQTWHSRITATAAALFLAAFTFSLLLLTLNDSRDFVAVALAFLILVPSICIVPYFTLLTRNLIAGVVFTLVAVAWMKFLGCIVVVLIYGWHADAHGHTDMPWRHPNLLVWLFLLNTAVLSSTLLILAKRRFQRLFEIAT